MKNFFNKLENTHKIDNFLGKYYLTIRNQKENKYLNRTKTVKKNLKFKIYPQKPSNQSRHFKKRFYQTLEK